MILLKSWDVYCKSKDDQGKEEICLNYFIIDL